MSCGIFIQNAEIHELKSTVQNIIAEHQLISTRKAIFNVFENFEDNLKQCPTCESYFTQSKRNLEKLLTDVSTQLIELGNFSLSILDNLGQSNQYIQELKVKVNGLQTKNSQLIHCLTQIQQQNQEMKAKLQEMDEMLTKADKQIIEIQMVNQQLKKSKILLENKIVTIQSSILEEKKSQINILQKELSDLRKKNLAITNQKQNLQRQVMCLNQELRTQSFFPSQCSLKIESRSQSCKRSPQIKIGENQLGDQPFIGKLPVEEFNMSPALIQTKSSLQQDIGSEKAFNFCLCSPAISDVSLADHLQNQSRMKSVNPRSSEDKENQNTINKFEQQGAAQKSQKQQNQTNQALIIETHDKGVQVNFISQVMCVSLTASSENEVYRALRSDSENKSPEIGKVKLVSEKSFTNVQVIPTTDKPLLSKLINYLSKVCITDRIKSRKNLYL